MVDDEMKGYRKKPLWINRLAFLFLMLPLGTFLDLGQRQLPGMVDRQGVFLFDLAGSWIGALCIFVVSRLTIVGFGFLSGTMIIVKFTQIITGILSVGAGSIILAVWMVTAFLLVATVMERPYLYPKLRWWSQPERFPHVMHGSLLFQGIKFPVVALNISKNGVFLKLDERLLNLEVSRPGTRPDQERRESGGSEAVGWTDHEIKMAKAQLEAYPDTVDQEVVIQLSVPPNLHWGCKRKTLTGRARVAWVARADSHYRFGIGMEMIQRNRSEQKAWTAYVNAIKSFSDPAR